VVTVGKILETIGVKKNIKLEMWVMIVKKSNMNEKQEKFEFKEGIG